MPSGKGWHPFCLAAAAVGVAGDVDQVLLGYGTRIGRRTAVVLGRLGNAGKLGLKYRGLKLRQVGQGVLNAQALAQLDHASQQLIGICHAQIMSQTIIRLAILGLAHMESHHIGQQNSIQAAVGHMEASAQSMCQRMVDA